MPRKPVVFVPGLPASELVRNGKAFFPPSMNVLLGGGRSRVNLFKWVRGADDLATDDGVKAGGVIRHATRFFGMKMAKEAETLYALLQREMDYTPGLDFAPVGWDWRLPVDAPVTHRNIAAAVNALWERYGDPVVVVMHSTGGLVVRSFLESGTAAARQTAGRIGQLVAFGVPWVGTLKSMRMMQEGGSDLVQFVSDGEVQQALARSWAAYDLLPPDPATTEMKDDEGPIVFYRGINGKPASPMKNHQWVPDSVDESAPPRLTHAYSRLGRRARTLQLPPGVDIPVVNVVGYGVATDTEAAVTLVGGRSKVTFTSTRDGDGTIPRRSAEWLHGRVTTYRLPAGIGEAGVEIAHSQLWDCPPARELLARVLIDRPPQPIVYAAMDEGDLKSGASKVRIRVVGYAPDGGPLPNGRAYFGPAAKQSPRGKEYALDAHGRIELMFTRNPAPAGGYYSCPLRVKWGAPNSEETRSFALGFPA